MDFKNLNIRFFTSISLLFLIFTIFYFFQDFVIFFIIAIYLGIFFEVILFFKKNLTNFIYLVFYILFSLACILLYFLFFYKIENFILFIFLIILFDSFSYISGSLFGKKKILPKISPNKTYVGFFFGLFLTIFLINVINLYYFIDNHLSLTIFSILIILSSFIGDIIESYYKRFANIKNSSNILPGHGGIFDRLDGFVFGSITLFSYNYFL